MFRINILSFAVIIILASGVCMLSIGCGTSTDNGSVLGDTGIDCASESAQPFRDDLTIAQADSLITASDGQDCFAIIDVRTSAEYNAGHIPGALKYDIYTDEFDTALTTLDKDAVYLVYCRSGNRSATAANRMRDAGFTAVYNMLGGFNDWAAEEYPVEM